MKDAKSKTISGEDAAQKLAALLTSARVGFMATPANDTGTEWSFQVLPGDGRALAKAHAAASEPEPLASASFTQSMAKLLPNFVSVGKKAKKRKEVGFAKLFGTPPHAILVQLIHDDPDEKGNVIRVSWQSSLPLLDICSVSLVFKENMEAKAIEKFDEFTHADASNVVAKTELEHLEAFGKIAGNIEDPENDEYEDDEDDPRPPVTPKYGDPRAYHGGCGITEDG